MHGKITAALAGSATVLTSLASAAVNLPIVWRIVKDKIAVKALTIRMATVIGTGIAAVAVDRIFQFSELLVRK
jgi:dihydroxyacetone kinase DhaKLM complex PTS-EIIA-like component DhaM